MYTCACGATNQFQIKHNKFSTVNLLCTKYLMWNLYETLNGFLVYGADMGWNGINAILMCDMHTQKPWFL